MSHRVRHPVHGVLGALAAQTLRIRRRLSLSVPDAVVLAALGKHFDRLQGKDLAERCRAGMAHDKEAWATRK